MLAFSCALLVVQKLGERLYFSLPVAVFVFLAGTFFCVATNKHAAVFKENYEQTKFHEDKLYVRGILSSESRVRGQSAGPGDDGNGHRRVNW